MFRLPEDNHPALFIHFFCARFSVLLCRLLWDISHIKVGQAKGSGKGKHCVRPLPLVACQVTWMRMVSGGRGMGGAFGSTVGPGDGN